MLYFLYQLFDLYYYCYQLITEFNKSFLLKHRHDLKFFYNGSK